MTHATLASKLDALSLSLYAEGWVDKKTPQWAMDNYIRAAALLALEEASSIAWHLDVKSKDEYQVDALTLRNGIFDAIRALARDLDGGHG